MAMHARPVPLNPYNPLPVSGEATIRHPSPFMPIRLPIFAVVIWLNDWLVRLLSVGGARQRGGERVQMHKRLVSDGDECYRVEEGKGN